MIEGLFQTSGNQQASSILNRANVKTGSKCCSLIMGGFLAGWATNGCMDYIISIYHIHIISFDDGGLHAEVLSLSHKSLTSPEM